jgi:HEPN domain-containing protein
MKPHIEEALRALRLAERDIKVLDVIKREPVVHFSIVGFHAQQATEKSLKAVLFSHRIEFERTHDLVKLAGFLHANNVTLPVTDNQLRRLNPFAVTFRYDDMEIDMITQEETADLAVIVHRWSENQVRSLVENEEKHNPAEE